MFETEETLERRLSEMDNAIGTVEKAPSTELFRTVQTLINEFDVMLAFFSRDEVYARFNWLKGRALNIAVEHNVIMQRMQNPDPFEVPEIRDFIVKGAYECDKCHSARRIAMRISNSPKPIRTIYKCLECGHTDMVTIQPAMVQLVLKHGKEVKMDHIPVKAATEKGRDI